MAGQNIGADPQRRELNARTAFDVKEVHRALADFPDEELQQVPILPPNTRLEQGATYIDLRDPDRAEFTATGGMTTDADSLCVPKDRVPYNVWNHLLGEERD